MAAKTESAEKSQSSSIVAAAAAGRGLERSDSSAAARRLGGLSVSSKLQKEKIANVMGMVEREGAVIEAVMMRLERLGV